MDTTAYKGQRNTYLKTAFAYNYLPGGRTNYNEVNLCLQDNPGYANNYFFMSDPGFFADWVNFTNFIEANSLDKNSFSFEIIPFNSLKNNKRVTDDVYYSFPYDMKLFDSYDSHPIKVYKKVENDFCDVFTGSYFMMK